MNMISTSKHGTVTVISLAGKWMGGPEIGQLAELIRTELLNSGKGIVLDLLQVSWMNSSGIGALASALTSCQTAGAKLALSRVPADIQELLDITHLSSVFTICKTLEEAVQAVQ
ncbi:MAG: STAS domain-containing protein [bacterium]|nr:STAS domain-containing protein [bacterium]